jgi:hypothetical protein
MIYRSRAWVRALLATENDKLGLILRAAMAKPTKDPPWLGPSAITDHEGMILSNWVDEHNKFHFAAGVCTVEELVDNLRRLCDSLRLSQEEAESIFLPVRQWITIRNDTPEKPEDRVPIEYRRNET